MGVCLNQLAVISNPPHTHTHSQLNVLIHYHRLFRVSIKTFLVLLVTIQRQYDLSTKVNAPRAQEAEAEEDMDDDDMSSDQTDPVQEDWVRATLTVRTEHNYTMCIFSLKDRQFLCLY